MLRDILFEIALLLLFANLSLSCRAFHLVLETKRQHTHRSRASLSKLTPKMTISNDSGTVAKKDEIATDKFNYDLWQAGGITSFSQTCFAEYWHDLPSIVSNADSSNNNEKNVVVNPYDFRHRMALNKYLIEHTGSESMYGTSDVKFSKHPIWGFAAQLDWQWRSGRFEDPSKWQDVAPPFGNTKCNNISKRSWWGYMNLLFSVAQYCGAAEAGLVPSISISDESVLNDTTFQTCVGLWKLFWENGYTPFLDSRTTSKDENEQLTMAMYRALWETHTAIIKTGILHGKDLKGILPKEDRSVALGWCNMVELFSASNWPLLSLDSLYKFGGGYLPSIRLAGPKGLQWLKANRRMEFTTYNSLCQLMDTPEKTMKRASRFVGRVSRWKFAVNKLPRTLHVLTHGNPIQQTLALARVVTLAIFPRSIFEIGIAVFAMSILAMVIVVKK